MCMKNEKEILLKEIDKLISYGKEETTISPDLLKYFTIEELEGMKANLLKKVGRLKEEDMEWLEQFKKYD